MTSRSTSWREVSLGDICEFKYGKSLPESQRVGSKVPVYGSNGMVGSHVEAITQGPTIVVGRKGSFGEVHFSTVPCWPIDTTYYIDATATRADLRWLTYRLSGLGLTQLNRAAAVPGLNREDAYRKRLLLPPPAEQRRIAEVLDRAEALRAKRRSSLTQLDTLAQSIFFDLFGDLATNSLGLPIKSLGDYLSFVTSGSRGWAEFYAPTGSRFIRSLDVRMNYIGDEDVAFVIPPDNAEARRTRVMAGDVLLTITGSRIGRVAPVPTNLKGAYISQHVAILRVDPKHINPIYLSFFLSLAAGGQRQIAREQYGQTKPGLNFEQIRRFQIPIPAISLQQEFTRRVAAIEKLKRCARATMTELDLLFAVLQHHAFHGELGAAISCES